MNLHGWQKALRNGKLVDIGQWRHENALLFSITIYTLGNKMSESVIYTHALT